MKRWTLILALLSLLTTVLACGGGGATGKDQGASPGGLMSDSLMSDSLMADKPVAVELHTAALESVARVTRATGSIEALRRVSPGTKILGRIERVTVGEGDRVTPGMLLAKLESRDLEAAVHQAEAAVRLAEAKLENARAQRDRMVGLHARGSVTDKNFEDATAGFGVAEAALDQTRANLASVRVTLSYAEVRSPIHGWIVEQRVEAGDMATPGAPLFSIEDLSRVKVHVQVPEADIVGLEEGAPARVTVLDRQLEATVDRIVPAGDPASRTFLVKLLLDNPQGLLKSGMFARVSFTRGERHVMRVPETALIVRGQLEGLFVADDGTGTGTSDGTGNGGRLRLRWIKTGRHEDGYAEILSGLGEGERYVKAPPSGLVDGAPYSEIQS